MAGMLDPENTLKLLQASAQQMPATPGFASPWEQMAFNTGGMLGGAIGNQVLIAPQIKAAKELQAAQAQELTDAMSGQDKLENVNKAADILFGRGKTKEGIKFLEQARDIEKGRLEKDKLARRITADEYKQNQEAIENKFKERRLGIEQQRADAYAKSVELQGKTSDQKITEGIRYLRNAAKEAEANGETQLAQDFNNLADKKTGVKKYATGGTKGIRQTQKSVEDLGSVLKVGDSPVSEILDKDNLSAYNRAVATMVNKKSQELRAKNQSFDETTLIKDAHSKMKKYLNKEEGGLSNIWGLFGSDYGFDYDAAIADMPELEGEDTQQDTGPPPGAVHSMVGDDGITYYYDADGNPL